MSLPTRGYPQAYTYSGHYCYENGGWEVDFSNGINLNEKLIRLPEDYAQHGR